MLVEIDTTNDRQAVALLADGFPTVAEATWWSCLARIRHHAENDRAGVAPGYLMMTDGTPSGVVLTPTSLRRRDDDSCETIVNLSSWYVRPDQRWRAPLMMRRVLLTPASRITSLTPTPAVQAMMPALGLHPLNAGETFVFLPCVAGARFSGARVDDHDAAQSSVRPWLRALVERHQRLGCLAAALDTPEGSVTLLFKRRLRRGLPTLQLLFCDRNSALVANIDSVARYLLARGHLLLVMDVPLGESTARPMPGMKRPSQGCKFANAPLEKDTTDHAGSELALFDF
jgi:hypothetical protein